MSETAGARRCWRTTLWIGLTAAVTVAVSWSALGVCVWTDADAVPFLGSAASAAGAVPLGAVGAGCAVASGLGLRVRCSVPGSSLTRAAAGLLAIRIATPVAGGLAGGAVGAATYGAEGIAVGALCAVLLANLPAVAWAVWDGAAVASGVLGALSPTRARGTRIPSLALAVVALAPLLLDLAVIAGLAVWWEQTHDAPRTRLFGGC